MLGIVPAAGLGSRIQPLAFSKELLPVGSRVAGGVERPRAVSEYVVERMLAAGADSICFVIAPGKADIVKYYGSDIEGVPVCYMVQPEARGLCDAVFRALPLVRREELVLVGLPDTVWFPIDGYRHLDPNTLSFLLFPTQHPERFDAVETDERGRVREIQVKQREARSRWIWGGFSMPGHVFTELHALWTARSRADEYIGTLVNEYLVRGAVVTSARAGTEYFDVGTIEGYREAMRVLGAGERTDGVAASP